MFLDGSAELFQRWPITQLTTSGDINEKFSKQPQNTTTVSIV